MKRLHIHVSVDDLAQSTRFYSTLFAAVRSTAVGTAPAGGLDPDPTKRLAGRLALAPVRRFQTLPPVCRDARVVLSLGILDLFDQGRLPSHGLDPPSRRDPCR